MDIVRPEQRAKGECDQEPKEDPQKLPEKRGENQGSLLPEELVGEANVKITDDKSPPVLLRRGGHKKKRSLPLGSTEWQ